MQHDDAQAFLTGAAEALHRFGTAAHSLEAALLHTAGALGVQVAVFATPTSIMLGFGPPGDQRITLLRVSPSPADLGKLADVDALLGDVAAGRRTPAEGLIRLGRIDARRRRYPPVAVALAGALSSAGAAVLFGGGAGDVVAGGLLGLVMTLLEMTAERSPALSRALLSISAFVATAGARLAPAWWPDVHPPVVALSAIVVMLPGLTFTTAMMELATANLASGMARLAGAGVTLVSLMLGVALAQALVPLVPSLTDGPSLAAAWMPLVLLVTPICIGVLLRVRRKDLPIALLASVVAWAGSYQGVSTLGVQVGAGAGAFALAAFANGYARLFDRPATVPLVAGSILLVPGSLGYRSLTALLAGDVLVGVEQAFQMAMVASALAAGMLFGAAIVPTRRPL